MFIYIPSKELIINTEHIIRAQYYPTNQIEDEWDDLTQTRRSYVQKAQLHIFTSELQLSDSEGYEGKHLGTASKSKCLTLNNLEADYMWDALKRDAYALSRIPEAE